MGLEHWKFLTEAVTEPMFFHNSENNVASQKAEEGQEGVAEANCFLNFLYASIESHEGDISLVLTKGKNCYRTKF